MIGEVSERPRADEPGVAPHRPLGGGRPVPEFERLFGQTSDAVFVVGLDFRIVWWGPRAEEVLGIPAAEALGRRCFEVIGGRHEAGQARCGVSCWVMQAARVGKCAPSFCLDVRRGRTTTQTFTVGFMTTGGEYVVHIMRPRSPPGEPAVPAEPLPAIAAGRQMRLGRLTRREHEVLALIMRGATSHEIARRLSISHATARNHVQNVLGTLGVHTKVDAAVLALSDGLAGSAQPA